MGTFSLYFLPLTSIPNAFFVHARTPPNDRKAVPFNLNRWINAYLCFLRLWHAMLLVFSCKRFSFLFSVARFCWSEKKNRLILYINLWLSSTMSLCNRLTDQIERNVPLSSYLPLVCHFLRYVSVFCQTKSAKSDNGSKGKKQHEDTVVNYIKFN